MSLAIYKPVAYKEISILKKSKNRVNTQKRKLTNKDFNYQKSQAQLLVNR